MNYELAAFAVALCSLLVNIAMFWYVQKKAKEQAKESALEAFRSEMEGSLSGHNNRIIALESHSHPKPSMDPDAEIRRIDLRVSRLAGDIESRLKPEDLGELYEKINDVAKDTSEMKGKLDGLSANLNQVIANYINRATSK